MGEIVKVHRSGGEIVTRHPLPALEFTPEQRIMIRDSFANGATDQEFQVLMAVATARRLNPLLKQIYFVKRWDSQKRREVWSTQVSIDGLRAIADRTGLYAGQDEPEFIEDGNGIKVCKVRVYRKDWPRPAVGVAYWSEYVQFTREGKVTHMWETKGHVMVSKCAEGTALRKAFPEDMSGLYAPEEFGCSEAEIDKVSAPIQEPAAYNLATVARYRSDPENEAPQFYAGNLSVHPSSVGNEEGAAESKSPAFDALSRAIEPLVDVTLLQAARVWRHHRQAIYSEAAGDAKHLYDAQQLVLGATKVGCTRNQVNEHIAALEARDSANRDSLYADTMDLLELAETAGEVVEIWRANKTAIDLRSEELRSLLRKLAMRRVQELENMADAKQAGLWLKNALEPKPETAPGDSDDLEREAIATEGAVSPIDEWRAHAQTKRNAHELARSFLKREREFKRAGINDECLAITADLIMPLLATDSRSNAVAFIRNQAAKS